MLVTNELSQDVRLNVEREGFAHEDDPAWVEMPFGPTVEIDMERVEKELAEYGYELIDPSEAEPEMISADRLRVWCFSSASSN